MVRKYIEPSWDKDSFTCPHCNTVSLMNFKRVNYQGMASCFHDKTRIWGSSWVGIATCYNCQRKVFL